MMSYGGEVICPIPCHSLLQLMMRVNASKGYSRYDVTKIQQDKTFEKSHLKIE
jgi:hypothetical protein